jgi:hypothetical protein
MEGKTMKRKDFLTMGSLLILGMPVFSGIKFKRSVNNITLIGDSIRTGYQKYISFYLNSQAEIWGPDDSRINSFDILKEVDSWFKNRNASIIHINTGLEDLKCIPFSGRENLVPLDLYTRNIERITKYIHRVRPGAVLIWATTTPVIQKDMNTDVGESGEFSFFPEDVIRYNDALITTCQKLGVPVNDLYQFVMSGEPSRIILEDGMHFTEMGYELLGEQVANAIQLFLD